MSEPRHRGWKTVTLCLSLLATPCLSVASEKTQGFQWASTAPLITPKGENAHYYGLKDPSVVYADGKYHVFMTTAGANGWGLAHASFTDWSQAGSAAITTLDKSPMGPGYRAAPQVFYFAPQKLWYIIYQGGDPLYSTTRTLDDPLSWSAPRPFFATIPEAVKAATGEIAWLDFWTICDEASCYLFFTDDHGNFFRSQTALGDFPNGFHDTKLVMKGDTRDDLFEASNTYRVAGTNSYVTLVEAIGSKGRYFRIWKSDALDGEWQPVTTGHGAAPLNNVFAGADNVKYDGKVWSEGISHGEMIRANADQTLEIDPCKPLQFLYQGLDVDGKTDEYIRLPYRLALITATGPNPISAMCTK